MMISSMRVSMMMSAQHVGPQAHDGIKVCPMYKLRLVASMLIRCQSALKDLMLLAIPLVQAGQQYLLVVQRLKQVYRLYRAIDSAISIPMTFSPVRLSED